MRGHVWSKTGITKTKYIVGDKARKFKRIENINLKYKSQRHTYIKSNR
jgi:hypothetical protein